MRLTDSHLLSVAPVWHTHGFACVYKPHTRPGVLKIPLKDRNDQSGSIKLRWFCTLTGIWRFQDFLLSCHADEGKRKWQTPTALESDAQEQREPMHRIEEGRQNNPVFLTLMEKYMCLARHPRKVVSVYFFPFNHPNTNRNRGSVQLPGYSSCCVQLDSKQVSRVPNATPEISPQIFHPALLKPSRIISRHCLKPSVISVMELSGLSSRLLLLTASVMESQSELFSWDSAKLICSVCREAEAHDHFWQQRHQCLPMWSDTLNSPMSPPLPCLPDLISLPAQRCWLGRVLRDTWHRPLRPLIRMQPRRDPHPSHDPRVLLSASFSSLPPYSSAEESTL